MIDNKYPLFSPGLMVIHTFVGTVQPKRYVGEGYRPSDPEELVSGAVGVAIEKMAKKIDPKNPYFSRVYQFAIDNDFDPGFFKKDDSEVKNKTKVKKDK